MNTKKILIIILSNIFCIYFSWAQQANPTVSPYDMFRNGVGLFKNAQFDLALIQLEKASEIYRETDSLGRWLWVNTFKSQVIFNHNKYDETESYERTIQFLSESIEKMWRAPASPQEWYRLASLHSDLAFYCYNSGNYLASKATYELVESIWPKTQKEKNLLIYRVYNELGSIYTRLEDFTKAEDYLLQALAVNLSRNASSKMVNTYVELGILSNKRLNFQQAIEYYESALNLAPQDSYKLGTIYLNLGEAYRKLKDFDQALSNLQTSQELFENIGKENYLARVYLTIAEIYRDQGSYSLAHTYYNDAIQSAINAYHTSQRREVAEIYLSKAEMHKEEKEYDLALLQYHSALESLIPNYVNKNIKELPEITDLYTERFILTALEGKADMFEIPSLAPNEKEMLTLSLDFHALCSMVEDSLRLNYDNESAKLNLVAQSRQRTRKALNVAYHLYELTEDDSYLDRAFHDAEKNKAVVLLDLMKQAQARNLSNLPTAIIHRETELRNTWTYLEKQVHEAELLRNASFNQLSQDRILARQAYFQYVDSIENAFPEFRQVVKSAQIVPVDSVQKELALQGSEFVEFFLGSEYIYAFHITSESFRVHRVELDSALSLAISHFPSYLDNTDHPEHYQKAALLIYQQLLAPLSVQTERLMIIPDGALGYIPFDALLTVEPQHITNLKEYAYLLHDKAISYAYSATLLRERRQKKSRFRNMQSFVGYAPEFEEADLDLSYLKFSEDEVNFIHKLWGGAKRIGQEATRDLFVREASQYRIVHISSHSQAKEEDPLLSHIYFYNSEGQPIKLYLADLYAMDLNADLVVLSACETSKGKLHPGEGIMSLARGFTHAGSKSLVTTLWSVPHRPTYDIMKTFYSELFSGKTKDEAVRQAKLNYISSENTNKMMAHPKFWAAYTPIGDMSPLKEDWKKYIWMVGAGLLLILSFLALRRIYVRRA